MGRTRARRWLLLSAALILGLGLPLLIAGGLPGSTATAAGGPTYNLQGGWITGYEDSQGGTREAQNGTYTITSMDMSSGDFSGTAVVEGSNFTVSGNESGSVATYTLSLVGGGYVAHDTLNLSVQPDGYVGGDGNFGTGNYYWAELTTPTDGMYTGTTTTSTTGSATSHTQVVCNDVNPGQAGDYDQCIATVGGSDATNPSAVPTGTVTFTVNSGASGGFLYGPTCTLSAGSGNTSYCSVDYSPAAPPETAVPVTANYSGDTNFAPSSGSPALGGIGTNTDTTPTDTTTTQTTTTSTTGEPTMSLSLSPDTVDVCGSSCSTANAVDVNVAVSDGGSGQDVSNNNIELSSSDADVSIGPVSAEGSGQYSAVLHPSSTAGDVTITATDNSTDPALTATATLHQQCDDSGAVAGAIRTAGRSAHSSGSGGANCAALQVACVQGTDSCSVYVSPVFESSSAPLPTGTVSLSVPSENANGTCLLAGYPAHGYPTGTASCTVGFPINTFTRKGNYVVNATWPGDDYYKAATGFQPVTVPRTVSVNGTGPAGNQGSGLNGDAGNVASGAAAGDAGSGTSTAAERAWWLGRLTGTPTAKRTTIDALAVTGGAETLLADSLKSLAELSTRHRDTRYRTVVAPVRPAVPKAPAGDGALGADVRALAARSLAIRSLAAAAVTTLNRGDSARSAHDAKAYALQSRAAARDLDVLATDVGGLPTLQRKVASQLKAHGLGSVTLTSGEVTAAQSAAKRTLPSTLATALAGAGMKSLEAAIRQQAEKLAPGLYAVSAALDDTALAADERTLDARLRAAARDLGSLGY